MANDISPKAEISPKAKIGDNCIIFPFVSILNGSRLGAHNKIHQGSVIGALPQDFDFTGEKTELIIGDNNIIRENVVINRATHAGGQTVIGNDNFLMEGAHISHDTKVGNGCIFGYGTKIAGDCEIGDGAIFSSNVVEKAGTRVGCRAAIQAGVTLSKDVPPYIVAGGYPVAYSGPNTVMMTEDGISDKVQKHIANAYRLVFHGQTSVFDAIIQINEQVPNSLEIRNIVDFINQTKKGIISKM